MMHRNKEATLRALGPSERFLTACHTHGDLQVGLAIRVRSEGSWSMVNHLPGAIETLQKRHPQLRSRIITREAPPSPGSAGWIPNPLHWLRTPRPLRLMELHDVERAAEWKVQWKQDVSDVPGCLTEAMRTPLDAEEGPMWQVTWVADEEVGIVTGSGTLSLAFHPVVADVFGALLIASELITLLNKSASDNGPSRGSTAPALESILPMSTFTMSIANVKAIAARLWGIIWAPSPTWAKTYPPPAAPLAAATRVLLVHQEKGQGQRLAHILRRRRLRPRALATAAGLVAARRVLLSAAEDQDGKVLNLNTVQHVDLRPYCSSGGNVNDAHLHGWLSTFLQVRLDCPYVRQDDPASFWDLCEECDRCLVVLRDPTLPIQALHVGSWLRGDPDETVTQPPCHSGRLVSDFGVVATRLPKIADQEVSTFQVESAWSCTSGPHMETPLAYQIMSHGHHNVEFMIACNSGYIDLELAGRCRAEFEEALRLAAKSVEDDHVIT